MVVTGPETSPVAHKITAMDTDALVFQGGSQIDIGPGTSGSVFGDGGAGGGGLNSVLFQSGSICAQISGTTPFGAARPNSVLRFQKGSLFRLDGAVAPSMSGRTYADFEYNPPAPTITTTTGGFTCEVDNLVVSQGTWYLNLTGTSGGANGLAIVVRGDVTVKAGAILNLGGAAAAPRMQMAGTTSQTITSNGTLTSATAEVLEVNNSGGDVMLATGVAWPGVIQFTRGRIITGGNALSLGASSTVTGAAQSTGWVAGNLVRTLTGASVSKAFDIGDGSTYAPVTVAMTGLTGSYDLQASTSTPDHPQIGSSGLVASRSVNRWWTLTPSGSPSFTSFDATFQFNPADVDPGADSAQFVVARYASGSWFSTAAGNRTATSTQALGVTGFGDFQIADPVMFTLNATAVGSGTVTKAPDQPSYSPGSLVTLTASPATGWHFTGWTGDLVGSANPAPVTMDANKTVTATFTIDQYALDVAVVGSGSVTKAPDQATYAYGSLVTLTASPAIGWHFSGWSGDTSGTANPVALTMDRPKSATAAFTVNMYALATTVIGSGTLTKQPDQASYPYGMAVTLTAASGTGYHFAGWSGDTLTAANPLALVMTRDRSLTATFSIDTFALSVATSGPGTVAKSPDQPCYD